MVRIGKRQQDVNPLYTNHDFPALNATQRSANYATFGVQVEGSNQYFATTGGSAGPGVAPSLNASGAVAVNHSAKVNVQQGRVDVLTVNGSQDTQGIRGYVTSLTAAVAGIQFVTAAGVNVTGSPTIAFNLVTGIYGAY